jgi:hypothetical protein
MPTAWPEPFDPSTHACDGAARDAAERVVEIVPRPRRVWPRVVGPGRRERAYLERLAALERELAVAGIVERGAVRRATRIERELTHSREAARTLEQREHRLILALGALQNENERLRARLATSRRAELGPARETARASRGLRSWLSRWLRA